ncbi:MAG: class 3 adenylate cyclase/ligand-binding sensor domain-containing protein [Paraglaciecola sp.]|jgi:class 3 adenylate cyclase/ligand-binding sensor domain-containing protein
MNNLYENIIELVKKSARHHRTWAVLCYLLFPFLLVAQSDDFRFRLYSFEDGLSHRNVFKVQQDTHGFIWLATINGLNKFDGHQFRYFNSHSTNLVLPNDYISDFVLDENNQIILGTGTELGRINPDANSLKIMEMETNSAILNRDRKFYNLLENEAGRVFTSTYLIESGETWLQVLDGSKLRDICPAKGIYPQHPIIEFDGKIWFGSYENELEAHHFSPIAPTKIDSTTIYEFSYSGGKNASFSRVIQLQKVRDVLFVLLDNGQVYYLKKGALKFQKHPITNAIFNTGESTSFLVKENGDIWVGGMSTLWLYRADQDETTNFNQKLTDVFDHTANFRQIFQDQTGVTWIATDFGALTISETETLFTNYLNEGNEYCRNGFCSTRGIAEDEKGNIYVSYYNSIHKINVKTGTAQPLFSRKQNLEFPYGILYHNNALYTGNGLKINLKNSQVDTITKQIQCAEGVNMIDFENEIWFGCDDKLMLHNTDNQSIRFFGNSSDILKKAGVKTITWLLQGKFRNYIWLGTKEKGLFKLDKNRGVIAQYSMTTSSNNHLSNNRIITIREDDQKNLWIATGESINRLHIPTGKIRAYTTENGLPNNFINSLEVETDSVIWASTDNGLARFDVESDTFNSFFETDGLSKNEFNRISSYQSKNGRLYFGGLNGINAFFPDENFVQKEDPRPNGKLIFTSFSKYDGKNGKLITRPKTFSQLDTIQLEYTDEFFIFNFALADFANPHSRQYSYQLDGYETDWSTASNQNVARYNNIPPGKYIFRVRAASGDGEWLEDELSVALQVKRAFYKEPWFFITLSLLALGLMYGIGRYRIYALQKNERILEEQVEIRTAQLNEEKQKSEELLLNILPASIAAELKETGRAKAKRHEEVTVLFTDFKGFVKIASKMEPEDLVAEVDYCFRAFDEITELHGLEKIKTIGDAYMCVGGITGNSADAPQRMIRAALEIQAFLQALAMERKEYNLPHFEARIGIHTGAVVAGIVGIKKFAYDIWGDTVNIASRMEQASEIGRVNISETTFQLVKDDFACTSRGKVEVKHKGEVEMYFVDGMK